MRQMTGLIHLNSEETTVHHRSDPRLEDLWSAMLLDVNTARRDPSGTRKFPLTYLSRSQTAELWSLCVTLIVLLTPANPLYGYNSS